MGTIYCHDGERNASKCRQEVFTSDVWYGEVRSWDFWDVILLLSYLGNSAYHFSCLLPSGRQKLGCVLYIPTNSGEL